MDVCKVLKAARQGKDDLDQVGLYECYEEIRRDGGRFEAFGTTREEFLGFLHKYILLDSLVVGRHQRALMLYVGEYAKPYGLFT
jgi:hypothetical protein